MQFISNRELSKIYHSHDFYEAIVLVEGSVKHKMNGIIKDMHAGEAVILLPGDFHCFVSQSENFKLLGLSIKAEEFLSFSKAFETDISEASDGKNVPFVFRCNDKTGEITRICKNSEQLNDIVVNCRLLLCMILNTYIRTKEKTENSVPEFLEKAVLSMRLIENCVSGVPMLMNLTNYSYPHLYRLTKKHYGKTPHELILEIRLETAYGKVVSSDEPIEFIAQSVGYESLSHFNSVFKNKFAFSPASLRKKFKTQSSI